MGEQDSASKVNSGRKDDFLMFEILMMEPQTGCWKNFPKFSLHLLLRKIPGPKPPAVPFRVFTHNSISEISLHHYSI